MVKQKKNVVILGATGSIGQSALKVIAKHHHDLNLVGIACHSNYKKLLEIADHYKVKKLAIYDKASADAAYDEGLIGASIYSGESGMIELATLEEADIILIAVVGTTALKPAIEALRHNKDLAIANKEILVMAGQFIMDAAKLSEGRILPTDSEHNAIFQCMEGRNPENVDKIILTASGGPFRDFSQEQMRAISKTDALKHPNWSMGNKITIDSASMANKGLEIIEAHWLFQKPVSDIQAVVHPQSIVHSMIQLKDGSIIAQMSPPLMTFAIQNALLYPECKPAPDETLDFSQAMNLEFYPPDEKRFPCLRLAKESLSLGKCGPAAFNAANEVAVEAFLQDKIHFLDIPRIIELTFDSITNYQAEDLDSLIYFDLSARNIAKEISEKIKKK